MELPEPRGTLSAELTTALRDGITRVSRAAPDDDEDLHLSLWMLYELHYRGFAGVDEAREWDPDLIAVRGRLEAQFETGLRAACQPIIALADDQGTVPDQLVAITAYDTGISLPQFLQREATTAQYLEFLVQRSLYHLKESDPQAWALPRLEGPAKVALAELLYDEFGGGRPERLHSRLYAEALQAVDLDPSYGAYVDRVPGYTLAANNAMSLFGLHGRLRGAAMGHLAAFEMTSSLPCRRFLQGARRLELGGPVERYFDEHVEADAVHEHLAARAICGALVDAEPQLRSAVLFGAAACVHLDAVAADQMIGAWTTGRSALLPAPDREVA
ncbi:iron-containing redox enzyme family protein [Nocardioides sp. HM23]|uniref:iron-containing redox enzyme family protein n=1 Tax=Nocardioides bizhenqiangii TaxID=3095076 RepID=UPI002ACA9385|nr:iron-containing redox enzyme family protein [Nocardioides sp. HM23]MDZ5622410.1 iron-containing redox enzyme family protein [Nocardioides sp. HM23]